MAKTQQPTRTTNAGQHASKPKHRPKVAVAVAVAEVAAADVARVRVADKARVAVAVSAGAHQLVVVAAADRVAAAGKPGFIETNECWQTFSKVHSISKSKRDWVRCNLPGCRLFNIKLMFSCQPQQ
jgi:hypothetical protein